MVKNRGLITLPILLYQYSSPYKCIKCPGISPKPREYRVTHRSLLNIGIIHIGYLKFTPTGGFDSMDDLKDRRIVDIQASDCIAGPSPLGLFLNRDDHIIL